MLDRMDVLNKKFDELRVNMNDEINVSDVAILLAQGVDVNYRSTAPQGWTLLMKAISGGNVEIVKFLLENCKDINLDVNIAHEMANHWNAIIVAARYAKGNDFIFECLKLLVETSRETGLNLNYETQNELFSKSGLGQTALTTVADLKDTRSILYLLDARKRGFDISLENLKYFLKLYPEAIVPIDEMPEELIQALEEEENG